MILEKSTVADQKVAPPDGTDSGSHPALALLAARPELFQEQGSVIESWRSYRGRRLGPYFRLIYRADRKQRSIYLGSCPQLAARVRHRLEEVQKLRRERRQSIQRRAAVRTALRAQKKELATALAELGLVLKGWEARGFRARRCSYQDQTKPSS
jgi:hypothetical protein